MKLICPRGFMAISDGHSGPEDVLPKADWLVYNKARELAVPLIKVGDSFDLIIYGYKAFKGAMCINHTFVQGYHHQPIYLILGNHEGRIEWMRKLFRGSNVHVCKTLDIDVNGKKFHLEHGDRFAFDWNHLGFLFKGVAFFMLRVAPKLWLRLTRKWQPGAMKKPRSELVADKSSFDAMLSGQGTESGKLNMLIMNIWMNGIRDAEKHERTNIIGHTHNAGHINEYSRYSLFDAGDSRDGSAVYVDAQGNGSIRFFGGKE